MLSFRLIACREYDYPNEKLKEAINDKLTYQTDLNDVWPLLLAAPMRTAVPGYVLKACGFCAHTPGNGFFQPAEMLCPKDDINSWIRT